MDFYSGKNLLEKCREKQLPISEKVPSDIY